MNILGIRTTTSEFSYVVIIGNQRSHKLKEANKIKFPTGYKHCERLKWFYQEIGNLIKTHQINAIGVKGTEPMAMKGKSYGERMELEGMVFLQASLNGIKHTDRKVNSTMAKDLGMKGKGKYLAGGFDYSEIVGFSDMSTHLKEAVQVALSMAK